MYQSSLWARLDNGFEHCLRSEDLMQRAWAHASTGTSPWPSHRKFCRFLLNPETRTGLVIAVHARTGTSRRMPKVWPCRIPCKLVTDSSKCGRKIVDPVQLKNHGSQQVYLWVAEVWFWTSSTGKMFGDQASIPSACPWGILGCVFHLRTHELPTEWRNPCSCGLILIGHSWQTISWKHQFLSGTSTTATCESNMKKSSQSLEIHQRCYDGSLATMRRPSLLFFQHAQFSFGTKQGGQTEGIMMGQAAGTIFRLVLVAHEMRQWQLLHDWHSSSKISIAVSLECTLWMTCGLPFSTF